MNDAATTPQGPRKPTLLGHARAELGALRRWARNFFAHDRVTSSLKTLAWVVPLTLLIWVYAEREQLYIDRGVPVPITVTSTDPTIVVTLLRPLEGMILADLEGPRSQVEAVRQQLAGGGGGPVAVVVDKLARGHREISTAMAVERDRAFTERGIKVSNCQPPVLQVFVDVLEDRDLPILAPPTVTNLTTYSFEPATVKVRAPKRVWEQISAQAAPQAYADLAGAPELATPGEHELANVRISVPALQNDQHVSFTPSTVRAFIEVRQADRTLTLPTVVIYPLAPANLLKQYRVECQELINNVTVIGPPDRIALLEKHDYQPRPKAALDIDIEDVGPARRKRLRFIDLPDGVKPIPEDAQREHEFRLVPISPDQ